MKNNNSAQEAVSTLVHEALHISRYRRGFTIPTQYEEYLAYRREFLFSKERRPSLLERKKLWDDVQSQYEHLPLGKSPIKSRY